MRPHYNAEKDGASCCSACRPLNIMEELHQLICVSVLVCVCANDMTQHVLKIGIVLKILHASQMMHCFIENRSDIIF